MIEALKIITAALLLLIIAFHLFNQISNAIIFGIYPYILAMAVFFSLLIIITRFFTNSFIRITVKFLFFTFLIFFCFTFLQIARNALLLNGYQRERSEYMDQLHKITRIVVGDETVSSSLQGGIVNLIEANTGIPVVLNNEVTLMKDGMKLIEEMMKEIKDAKDHVHIEFFIIRDDEIGRKFTDLLITKAREGVEVRLIYDGLGSIELNKEILRKLKKGGVMVEVYDNVLYSILKGKLNHRNHRKIMIIDGVIGYVGGFNIGNEYLGRDEKIGPWNDLQMKARGDIVQWMQKIFLGDWFYVSKEKIIDRKYFPRIKAENSKAVQMITSGYDTHWNEISQLYFSMITGARKKIYIATPYLILNDSMVRALQTAALRGVDVRIIIPEKPDLFLVGWANSSFYKDLLKAGVKLYLFGDGFLHSKALTADDEITSVGSANLNTRSLYLDYEANAVIYDEEVAKNMNAIFQEYFSKSQQLTLKGYKKHPASHNWLKHILSKLMIPFA